LKVELIITADKSPTLYVPELDEHYHSVNGALQESQHIFINNGLKQIKKDGINILEIGFGTGLNALLTYTENLVLKKEIYYEAIEKYPLTKEILKKLKQSNIFNSVIARQIQRDIWNKKLKISKKQPKLWTEEIFTNLYKATNKNGILITYSAKGIVKQAMRNAGFIVKRLPGPKGKRHMVQAVKI